MGYQPMGHLLLDTTYDIRKYVAVMLVDIGECSRFQAHGFQHAGYWQASLQMATQVLFSTRTA